jgi:hypothetical protein
MKRRIVVPRELLLVEVERRCAASGCNARMRIGLTKSEARDYRGFECERCKLWVEDSLSERDVPEWWEELAITGLESVRQRTGLPRQGEDEVVIRMSDAYRNLEKNEE